MNRNSEGRLLVNGRKLFSTAALLAGLAVSFQTASDVARAQEPPVEKPKAEAPANPAPAVQPAVPAPAAPALPGAPAPVQVQVQVQGGNGNVQVIQVQGQGNVQLQVNGQVQVQAQAQAGGAVVAVAAPVDTSTRDQGSVFRAPPRELMQRFSKSEQLIAERRYAEAVEMLGSILEEREDYSHNFDASSSTRRSLKGEAQRRIGELPAEGRAAYELQYGAKARQLLDAAIDDGAEATLAEVSRRYFHTEAGYQATYLLGMHHLDHGRPLASALCLRRLHGVPSAAAAYEPELSLKLATSWARAGSVTNADDVLNAAKQKFPGAAFNIAGRTERWYGGAEKPHDWLAARTVGPAATAQTAGRSSMQWAMYRGDPSRNAVGDGGNPLLNRRWAVPFVNHPEVEELIGELADAYDELDYSLLPTTHPLAVGDLVLMRTITGLTAVDFRTGKRVWRGADDEYAQQLLSRETNPSLRETQADPLVSLVDDRLWRNAAFGTSSSDGRSVYCIEDVDGQQSTEAFNRRVIMPQARRFNSGFANSSASNRLVAYDLASEGKLLWEVGNPYGDEPEEEAPPEAVDPNQQAFAVGATTFDAEAMNDTRFLGPPLPLGDRLYALGETKGEIRLIVLHAKDGTLDWQQQLALVAPNSDRNLMRSIGLSPSYADGILVCPTSLGAVVAVDMNDRSLLWGFQYGGGTNNGYRMQPWQVQQARGQQEDAKRWQDFAVTLAEGKAVVTPPESDKIYCLNVLDGTLLWEHDRDQGLYVGCVTQGLAVVVGLDELRGYDLANGDLQWSLTLSEDSQPSGRGFYNGLSYFLPLSSAEVAAIDIGGGRFLSRSKSRTGSVPGNLICYRGAVISQGTGGLECFFQLDDLRRDVTAKLAADPDDAAALASNGELLLDEGKIAEAVAALRRSYAKQPEPRTRNLFIDALLEGLRSGVASSADDLADLEALTVGGEREELYLRSRALAHEKAGQYADALRQYLRLIDGKNFGDEPVRVAGGSLSIQRERWVRGRLDSLRAAGGPEVAGVLEREIESRLAAATASDDTVELRKFLDYFGDHPSADGVRLRLAARLLPEGSLIEAENMLRTVAAGGKPETAREATARLAQLLVDKGRRSEALDYLDQLAGPWADEICLDGKRGGELASALATAEERRSLSEPKQWPAGKVDVAEVRAQPGMSFRPFPLEFRGERGAYFRRSVVALDHQQQALVGQDEFGVELWRISLSEAARRGMQQYNPMFSHVRADGHLVVLSAGHELIGIDTLGTGAKGSIRILWRIEMTDSLLGAANGLQQMQFRHVQMNWGGQRAFAQANDGSPLGITGPARLRYVSFLKRRALHVVDPLTGKTLWIRHDIDPSSEIFGDDEYLFVAGPGEEKTLVLRATDGEQVKTVSIPKQDERVMDFGRKLLCWQFTGGKAELSLRDMFEEKTLWKLATAGNARLIAAGESEIGLFDRKGNFKVVSIADGNIVLDAAVQAEPNLIDAYMFPIPQGYALLTNRVYQQRDGVNVQAVGSYYTSNPIINGFLYGFDRTTKKELYRTRIEGHGLPLHQPKGVPMLVFASQLYETAAGVRNRQPQAVILAVDKRNGRTLYDQRFTSRQLNMIDVVGEPQRNAVLLKSMPTTYRFSFTDEPVTEPAAPPDPADKQSKTDAAVPNGGTAVALPVAAPLPPVLAPAATAPPALPRR